VLESTSDSAKPSLMPSENRITVSPRASGTERVMGCTCSAPMKPAFGTSVMRDGRLPRSARNSMLPILPTPSHDIVARSEDTRLSPDLCIGEHERLRETVPDAVREQNHGIAQGERH